MDKKTMTIALVLCVTGFVIFMALAVFVAAGRSKNGVGAAKGRQVGFSDASGTESSADEASNVLKPPPDSDSAFVNVTDYAPHIRVNLRYADKHNFTGKKIYDFQNAYLRYGTVKKLMAAQAKLEQYGMGLEIWDAYRPAKAQQALWAVCPNPLYVADPSKGYSTHIRGNAVDVTLVDSDGIEMVMPTGFDNFTKLADRDYSDIEYEFARENVQLLEKIMKECGFTPYAEEWWHFTDTVEYDIAADFVPAG